jgi:hypothetical protein
MEGTTFYVVCSVIILLGSTISAIATVYNIAKNPAKKIKEKQAAELKQTITETIDEVVPNLLYDHDLETRDKYKADRENYLHEISEEVMEKMMERFENRLQSLDNIPVLLEKLDTLSISTKDILREKIIKIYVDNKDKKSLTTLEREKLDQFYIDYKKLKGNSYIDKYYKRMSKWKTVDDEEDDDNDML